MKLWNHFFSALIVLSFVAVAAAEDAQEAASDKLFYYYRVELLEKKDYINQWKPVEVKKKFKDQAEIRFRFISNTAGTMYMLNSNHPSVSMQPITFTGDEDSWRKYLGLGTHVGAGEVGLFPNPEKKGSLKFEGGKATENLLMVFVPDNLEDGQRAITAVPAGAEGWDFKAKTTYSVSGHQGFILFHHLQIKHK